MRSDYISTKILNWKSIEKYYFIYKWLKSKFTEKSNTEAKYFCI